MARVPRVSRLEYIQDFLEAIEEGLDPKGIERKLADRKQFFESEKYRALGRGAPFGEKQKRRLMIAKSTVTDCEKLCRRLGLIGEDAKLTRQGTQVLSLPTSAQSSFIGKLLLDSFENFGGFLIFLNSLASGEVSLPDVRHSFDYESFRECTRSYGLEIDALSFNAMRDLLSQLGNINWLPEKKNGAPWNTIYLTSSITKIPSGNKDPATFTYKDQTYHIQQNDVEVEEFKRTLWSEYLKRTGDVQLRPVFYSEIRTSVCRRLRIADGRFDSHLKELMAGESDIMVVWSSGTVPFSRDSASLLKNLPPKAADEQYMVYLKIGRR